METIKKLKKLSDEIKSIYNQEDCFELHSNLNTRCQLAVARKEVTHSELREAKIIGYED